MHETAEELDRLDALLDRSGRQARSKMLRRIFPYPEKSLNARQLSRLLEGTRHVALATSDRRGAPRVAPVDALFFHGRFYF